MTSPFSCSAASSGLPRLFHMSKPGSKWGPSSPGQELLCVSRRKFANLDLLRIRHFEKFDFRSDTHGTGLIHGKYQTGNRAIWLVDFLYQPSQELSRVINIWPSARSVRENIAQVHFLRVYGPSRFGEVHKHVKSEREQYSSVRTECEVNKWFIIWRNQQNSDLMWPWSIVNFSCVCQRLQQCKHEQSV